MKELVRCVAKGGVYPEISLCGVHYVVEDWAMTPFGERKLDAPLSIDSGSLIRKLHAESGGLISDETAHQNLSTAEHSEAYIMHRPSFGRKASGTNDGVIIYDDDPSCTTIDSADLVSSSSASQGSKVVVVVLASEKEGNIFSKGEYY